MSTLWTPGGDNDRTDSNETPDLGGLSEGEFEVAGEELERLREALRVADAADVVGNHCYGLFELAAIHLSSEQPNLAYASLAIDALSGVVEACNGRLGVHEDSLKDGLNQLRLAFVQVSVLAQGTPSAEIPDQPASS